MQEFNMQSKTLEQLRAASHSDGVSGVTLKGQGGAFLVQIDTRSGFGAVLSKARSNEPRRFGNPLAALNVLRDIGQDNPTRTKSFGQELRDKTGTLAPHPQLGRQGRQGLPEWSRERVVFPNCIVFHRVLAETRTVEILRVKHATQPMP
jgi:plasmid stabilization system protein ParE